MKLIISEKVKSTNKKGGGGGGGVMIAHVYLSLRFALGLLQGGVLLALPCQAVREAFVNQLRVCLMESSSGSILTGIRAFFAHLLVDSALLRS